MKKARLGILGASEIAFRRFLPALMKHENIEYIGVASRSPEKAKPFQRDFGGNIYSYDELINDTNIDAVYIPLPPALHYEWAEKALSQDKHILLEKPATTKLLDTQNLVSIAQQKDLAIHENYMFVFHQQLSLVIQLLQDHVIGEVREYRIDFGFPKRSESDFRYNKAFGGGALLDCGGYPIKLALCLLGNDTHLSYASLKYPQGYDVDLYGTALLENNNNEIAKISFGMDNAYKCSLEIWGSEGTIFTDRIFTSPSDFSPRIIVKKGNEENTINVEPDDQFYNSIDFFYNIIYNKCLRNENFNHIIKQSAIVDKILNN